MSDIDRVVAAIISLGRTSSTAGVVPVETRIQDYRECLKALEATEGLAEGE